MLAVVLSSALMVSLPPNVGHNVDPMKFLILALQGSIVGAMLVLGWRRNSED